MQKFVTWLSVVFITMLVTGCSGGSTQGLNSGNELYPYTQLSSNLSLEHVDGVSLQALGTGLRGTAVWSPSGSHFAFAVDPQKGTAVFGTTSPLHTTQVNLGQGRGIVFLTDKYAVVSSWSAEHDWLYPIKSTTLGKPVAWTAPTDTWQEWVNTTKGPGVITGGYTQNSVAMTMSDGTNLQLHGGQVYTSSDHNFGAVVGGLRMKRVVHPVGGVMDPTEHQPSPATTPITLWDFDSENGPRRLSTIHLASVPFPKVARTGELQDVKFSPNDKYVAVLIQGEYATGAKMLGETFIFSTDSGRLVGTAPYGNGMQWSPDSKFLWLGTPMPGGQGTDHIVDIHGKSVWSWPDSMNRDVVIPISSNNLLVSNNEHLDVWYKKAGLEPFQGIGILHGGAISEMAPEGTAALVDLWGPVVYVKWGKCDGHGQCEVKVTR